MRTSMKFYNMIISGMKLFNSIKLSIIALLFFSTVSSEVFTQELLPLDRYREMVVAYSYSLKQAKLKSTSSSEGVQIANKEMYPSLSLTADGTLNMNHLNAWSGPQGVYRTYTYSAMATLSQPIYAGGALSGNRKMAYRQSLIDMLSEENTSDMVSYQADAAYWSLSSAIAYMAAAEEYKAIIKKQLDLTSDRFNDGLIGKTDLLMISTRSQEAELQYISARENYLLSLQQFNILCGKDPDNAMVYSIDKIDCIYSEMNIYTIDQVLERRADYRAAAEGVIYQKAAKIAAMSKFNPSVNAYLAGGWNTDSPYLGQKVALTPIVGMQINIPIFSWNRRGNVARQQDAYISSKEAGKGITEDNIKVEFQSALLKFKESERQVGAAQKNMEFANENLDIVTFTYNEGKGSMVDVLTSQLSWIQARNNLIQANTANKVAIAAYRKAVSE